MACADAGCDFKPMEFFRRDPGERDILVEMKYCGLCHTDVHAAAGQLRAIDFGGWPCVPGHELAGVAVAVGALVTRFKVGDQIGVGCMVDSCGKCAACRRGEEQMCASQTGTYATLPKHGKAAVWPPRSRTLGGYSDKMVIHEDFAIKIPANFPLAFAGPVMCAGVTLFDPLRRYGAAAGGKRVAVVGLGGLGVMGCKIARAMGCEVTAVSRARGKAALAAACGAGAFLLSSDAAAMAAAAGSFDLVLNTVPIEHDYTVYSALTARAGGRHVILGLNSALIAGMVVGGLVCGARVVGSGIGGIEATQAAIDFCARHDIKPEIKVIPVEGINAAFTALDSANDAGVRHVIDISTLDAGAAARCEGVPPPTLAAGGALSMSKVVGAIAAMLFLGRWR